MNYQYSVIARLLSSSLTGNVLLQVPIQQSAVGPHVENENFLVHFVFITVLLIRFQKKNSRRAFVYMFVAIHDGACSRCITNQLLYHIISY